MCGIFGEVARGEVVDDLIEGLKRLEYRGYDSAGVAVLNGDGLEVRRTKGKIAELEKRLAGAKLDGSCGIAHTRWATHGRPSDHNAHPHTDHTGMVSLVHNGIIENYQELKEELERAGHHFKSETDSEVIAHLISHYYRGDLLEAVRRAIARLRGSYAIAVIHSDHPNTIVAAKHQSPLVVGHGDEGNYVASDVTAFLHRTKKVSYLKDGEIALVTLDGVRFFDAASGEEIEKPVEEVPWDLELAQKGGYPHFMLKEIMEEGAVFAEALRGRIGHRDGLPHLPGLERVLTPATDLIYLVACGTSWHAALIGRYLFEKLARVPAAAEIASEFRYRDPVVTENSALIAISQSGETADTLAAVRMMEERGVPRLGVVNVQGSSITQHCTLNLMTQAGPEISVASTKAFITQLAVLYLVVLRLCLMRQTLDEGTVRELVSELASLPEKIGKILEKKGELLEWAREFHRYEDFLYLGRQLSFPVALEGALKLKEISYIHAEGYPAGEMKHGPIALIDENCPTVLVAPDSPVLEKSIANLEEIKARGGEVLVITNRPEAFRDYTRWVFTVPKCHHLVSPVLTVVPLQLFAYYCAVERGTDVDQPRNLAKSVTVE